LILGMTGSGKTTFTSKLTKHIITDYGVPQSILDSKPAQEFDGYPDLIRSERPPKLAEKGQQVWRPPRLSFDVLNEYFDMILRDGRPRIVWINEVGSIVKGETNPTAPDKFNDLAQMAREFGITLIVETQKLARIPASAKAQATHIIRLRLSPAAPYDQRIGNRLVGLAPDTPEPRAQHGFKYRRIDGDEPCRYYPSYHDFF